MTGVKLVPALGWASFAAGLATGHVLAGLAAAGAFALINAVENRRRR